MGISEIISMLPPCTELAGQVQRGGNTDSLEPGAGMSSLTWLPQSLPESLLCRPASQPFLMLFNLPRMVPPLPVHKPCPESPPKWLQNLTLSDGQGLGFSN